MKLEHLAIATMSWARDEAEQQLLIQSLQQLSLLRVPAYVTDGGSPECFLDEVRKFHCFNVIEATRKGLWAQVKVSLQHAFDTGAPFVLYTEPDKLDFFKQLPQWLSNVEVSEQTGVVLAARNEPGMQSYPSFQQMTETTINNCCAEAIGKAVDYSYGPFIVNSKVIKQLNELPDDVGWGWRQFAFNTAARMGLQIHAIVGDHHCPASQQHDDARERIYRMKQMIQSVQGVVLSANAMVSP